MKAWEVTYSSRIVMSGIVYANTREEAEQKALDGDVEEGDHDTVSSTPWRIIRRWKGRDRS